MSHLIVSQQAARNLLDFQASASTYTMHLFKAPVPAGEAPVIGDFVEADFSGYASASLAGASSAVTVNGRAKVIWNNVAFSHNGGPTNNTVYGYYVTEGVGLSWHETFDTPILMQPGSPPIQIVPAFSRRSEFSA